MTPPARIAAAIEILGDLEVRRRPAADSLKDWGLVHRFAGSKDRVAIASLVYDTLRCRASSAWIMGSDTPRAVMVGALSTQGGLPAEAVCGLFSGEGYAPAPLSSEELHRLSAADLSDAPSHVLGNYPEWLAAAFARAFGDCAVDEGLALSRRAPVDLRVNTLRGSRDKALSALAHLGAVRTPLSPTGIRFAPTGDVRSPALAAEPAWVKGLVEVQDEGSQLASLLCGAAAGQQVIDLCAGGGGKALALAAVMENTGQIYATDTDGRRLMPIYKRLARAGARNIQVRAPRGAADVVADLGDRCDLVVIDAPCTGTGTWRRNPDAKWRTRPGALEQRIREQDDVLASAAALVKPGGRLAYITCSILVEENEDRVAAFLGARSAFSAIDPGDNASATGLPLLARYVSKHGAALRLSPRTSGTDGFFVALLKRS